jgi:hypothetical protein
VNDFISVELRTTGVTGSQRWRWSVRRTHGVTVLRDRQGHTRTFVGGLLRLAAGSLMAALSAYPDRSAAGSVPPD